MEFVVVLVYIYINRLAVFSMNLVIDKWFVRFVLKQTASWFVDMNVASPFQAAQLKGCYF